MKKGLTTYGVRELVKVGSPEALDEARKAVGIRLAELRMAEATWLELDRLVEATIRGIKIEEVQ